MAENPFAQQTPPPRPQPQEDADPPEGSDEDEPKEVAPRDAPPTRDAPPENEDAEPVVDSDVPDMSVAELQRERDRLDTELRGLEATQRQGGQSVYRPYALDEASLAEQDRSREELRNKINDRRDKLTQITRELAEKKAGRQTDRDEIAIRERITVPPGEVPTFDPMAAPTFPKRDVQRADEKVVEAESGVRYMPGGTFMQGAQTAFERPDVMATRQGGPGEPEVTSRYARSRRRSGLRRMLGVDGSVTQPVRQMLTQGPLEPAYQGVRTLGGLVEPAIDAATRVQAGAIDTASRVPVGVAGGYVRGALTGEPIPGTNLLDDPVYGVTNLYLDERYDDTRDDLLPRPEYAPAKTQGGMLSAPRKRGGSIDLADINRRLTDQRIRKQDLQNRISDLMEEDRASLRGKPQLRAQIAMMQDDIEQVEANISQLNRIREVSIPRERYEAQMKKRAAEADALEDDFSKEF